MAEEGFNAADHKQVKERERKTKRNRAQELLDLKAVLKLPEGRRFLWRFMAECGVEQTTFNPNAAIAAYASGRRDAGQMLKAWIVEADEKSLLLMIQESFNP